MFIMIVAAVVMMLGAEILDYLESVLIDVSVWIGGDFMVRGGVCVVWRIYFAVVLCKKHGVLVYTLVRPGNADAMRL